MGCALPLCDNPRLTFISDPIRSTPSVYILPPPQVTTPTREAVAQPQGGCWSRAAACPDHSGSHPEVCWVSFKAAGTETVWSLRLVHVSCIQILPYHCLTHVSYTASTTCLHTLATRVAVLDVSHRASPSPARPPEQNWHWSKTCRVSSSKFELVMTCHMPRGT